MPVNGRWDLIRRLKVNVPYGQEATSTHSELKQMYPIPGKRRNFEDIF